MTSGVTPSRSEAMVVVGETGCTTVTSEAALEIRPRPGGEDRLVFPVAPNGSRPAQGRKIPTIPGSSAYLLDLVAASSGSCGQARCSREVPARDGPLLHHPGVVGPGDRSRVVGMGQHRQLEQDVGEQDGQVDMELSSSAASARGDTILSPRARRPELAVQRRRPGPRNRGCRDMSPAHPRCSPAPHARACRSREQGGLGVSWTWTSVSTISRSCQRTRSPAPSRLVVTAISWLPPRWACARRS